jgi:hypothetical protein
MNLKDENNNYAILKYPRDNDTEYRDIMLKAYVCSMMDITPDDWGMIYKSKNDNNADWLIEMMKMDVEQRLRRLLK